MDSLVFGLGYLTVAFIVGQVMKRKPWFTTYDPIMHTYEDDWFSRGVAAFIWPVILLVALMGGLLFTLGGGKKK